MPRDDEPNSLRRRALLSALGTGTATLAGCSGGGGDPEATPTPTRTGDATTDADAGGDTTTGPTDTATAGSSLDLGCADDAHRPALEDQSQARYRVVSWHEVETVWPGTPAHYALLTHGDMQFVAFYDADASTENYERRGGRLTVGQRRVGCGSAWQFVQFDSWLKWDAHNYVTMAVDRTGRLHVSGNMHVTPLKYWRTREPLDVTTLERVPEMVGEREQLVTYPDFFRGPDDRLIFTYRSGSSGSGDQLYNVYDPEAREWNRLLDVPLVDGEGENNAYIRGPVLGPDDNYHVCWVWRRTPDASTNHDLSYARSPNLVDWEKSDGTPLELPITIDEAEIVDPVPAGGGMINGNTEVGFDTEDRVVLGYHKYDDDGNTQIYNARREADGWGIYRTSDWDSRWEFGGGGTIQFKVDLSPVRVDDQGRLVQSYTHWKQGSGTWVLDPATLRPTAEIRRPPKYPRRARSFDPSDDRLELNWVGDLGSSGEEGVHYALRWATLPSNRDQFRTDVPDPTSLRLYKFERNPAAEPEVVPIDGGAPEADVAVEAEAGSLSDPFEVQQDADASGGECVVLPDTPDHANNETGRAEFTVGVDGAGSYELRARTYWPDDAANSFYESVDGSSKTLLGNDDGLNQWHWITGGSYDLSAGEHTVTIFGREDGAKLDKLALVGRDG